MTAAHRPVPENTVVTPASVLTGQVIDVAGFAMHVWAADLPRAEALAATLRVAVPTSLPPTVHVRFEHRAAPPFHAPPFQWSGDVPIETRREGPDLTFVRSDLGLVARVTPEAIVVTGDATDLSVAFRASRVRGRAAAGWARSSRVPRRDPGPRRRLHPRVRPHWRGQVHGGTVRIAVWLAGARR